MQAATLLQVHALGGVALQSCHPSLTFLGSRIETGGCRNRGYGDRVTWRLTEDVGRWQASALLQVVALQATQKSLKWVFEAAGDGDNKHLKDAVPQPSSFELTTDSAVVGRLPDKADIVLPVATVSGAHARLEKREGTLYVTDLNSTNGTFINDKRIRAGADSPVPSGSLVNFGKNTSRRKAFELSGLMWIKITVSNVEGDEHLAVFKFTQQEISEDTKVPDDKTVSEDTKAPEDLPASKE